MFFQNLHFTAGFDILNGMGIPKTYWQLWRGRPKGFHHSEETKRKMSLSALGKHNFKHKPEAIKKIGEASKELWKQKWYRKKMFEVARKPNPGQFGLGFIPWNKGLKLNLSFKGKCRFGKLLRKRIKKEKCAWCNSTEKLELDHIIAICNGGANTEDNCQILCKKCNLEKRNKVDMVTLQLKQKRANSGKSCDANPELN